MVQITGFEIGKRVQVRINVVNKSKFSQRLVILPPSTSFFKIKFSKRGLIPSGLSEVIYLTFLPQKYQYYEDHIKVICEGDKMLIPIHATPKMNLHAKEYVPKYLDFGTVDINSTDSKDILLKNIIDLPFEYEIVPVKKTNEISIEPLMGEINANSFRVLTFKFSPKTYGFFKAEFEFRLSEHGYKNTVITVCGSCNTFDQNRFKKIKNLKGLHEIENDLKTFKHQDTVN